MPYITQGDLENYLGVTFTANPDPRVTPLLAAATSAVDGWCNRTFGTPGPAAETYNGSGTPILLLRRTPVTAIASVVADGSAVSVSAYSFTSSGLLYYGQNSSTAFVTGYGALWPLGYGNVTVTYTAGLALPDAVKQAALLVAANLFEAGPMKGSSDLLGAAKASVEGLSLDLVAPAVSDATKALLRPYRRLVAVG